LKKGRKNAARPNTREQSNSTVIRKLYSPYIWTHEKRNQYNTTAWGFVSCIQRGQTNWKERLCQK